MSILYHFHLCYNEDMKKHLFFTLILALTLTFAINTPTFAEDVNPNADEGIMLLENSPSDGSTSSTGDGEIGTGVNSEDIDPDSGAIECLEENCPNADNIEHEGTSGEPEVVCADPNEPGCENADESAESEPELWPVYVSLGALGTMIILVIIINLLGGKKRKKS